MTRKESNERRSDVQAGPEELLAAYADDALDENERQVVEAYLAEHPEARASVDEMRAVLTSVRALPSAPEGAHEPDWNAMAARVSRALRDEREREREHADIAPDARAREQRPGMGQRVREFLARIGRPRYVVGGLALAGAAALLIVFLTRDSGQRDNDLAETDEPTERVPAPKLLDGLQDRLPDRLQDSPDNAVALDDQDLTDDELLDELESALDAALEDAPPRYALPDTGDIEDLPDMEDIPEFEDPIAQALAMLDPLSSEDERSLETEPDDETWFDEFSDEELDTLDQLLDEMQAG